MSVPAAPPTPVETPTQDAPAPQVVDETTTAPAAAPETPVEGTEPTPSEQPEGAEQIRALAAWRDEQITATESAAAFRQAQSRNDLQAQHRRDLELAKADPVIANSKEMLALVKRGIEEGFDDPAEADSAFKKWLGENDGFARIMADAELTKGNEAGQTAAIEQASSDLYLGLSPAGQQELYQYVTIELVPRRLLADTDPKYLPHLDGYRQMRAQRDSILRAEVERELATVIETRVRAELGAAELAAEPGPVKVVGRASSNGKNEAAMLLDPNTPIDTVKEIMARRLAG